MGLTAERDTQCGLKGFSASSATALFGALRTHGFAFDVELLARARHEGIRTSPMAVSWNHSDGSRVRPVRDGIDMAKSAIAIRRAVGRVRSDTSTVMAPDAYSSMALVEADHWWFKGKHELVIGEIERHAPGHGLVVDVGAGTGGFLNALRVHGRPAVGVEFDVDALSLASRAHPEHALVRGSALTVPLRDGVAAAVTALDLIEHLDDDVAALGSLARVVDAGGVVIVTVPAYSWMWSDHDVRLGHRRRYTRGQLTAAAHRAGLEVIRCTHFHSWLTPPAFAVRRTPAGRLMKRPAEEASYVNPSVNRLLYRVTRVERAALRRVAMPVGLSILLVARRPVGRSGPGSPLRGGRSGPGSPLNR
jgi:SAM-dependent methyltransferase